MRHGKYRLSGSERNTDLIKGFDLDAAPNELVAVIWA
jgi:hypothetical protein